MADGAGAGLKIIESLEAKGDLNDYHLFHAAKADLFRRLGTFDEAGKSYDRALELATNESERRYLERRLKEVSHPEITESGAGAAGRSRDH
jgi:RNA polymerase sigma-70 factor (ECF subfamily)